MRHTNTNRFLQLVGAELRRQTAAHQAPQCSAVGPNEARPKRSHTNDHGSDDTDPPANVGIDLHDLASDIASGLENRIAAQADDGPRRDHRHDHVLAGVLHEDNQPSRRPGNNNDRAGDVAGEVDRLIAHDMKMNYSADANDKKYDSIAEFGPCQSDEAFADPLYGVASEYQFSASGDRRPSDAETWRAIRRGIPGLTPTTLPQGNYWRDRHPAGVPAFITTERANAH